MTRLTSLLFLVACTTSPSTGASCPSTHAPTYAGFGKPFLAKYCLGCHSVGALERHGAPRDQNFDTEAELKAHADAIDRVAAAGPEARNTDMPEIAGPVRMAPAMVDRERLGELLACERASP